MFIKNSTMKKIYILLISVFVVSTAQSQWVAQVSGITSALNSIFFTDASNGYAVGDAGKILKTTNGGSNWNSQTSGTTAQLNGVFFTSSTTGYVVGGSGVIRKTTSSGTSWSTVTSPTSQYLYGVYFTDANNGWAVGWGGTIVHTSDGSSWATQTNASTAPLYSVFFTSSTTGYAVGGSGTGGVILKTTNGGTNWNAQTCSATNTLRTVYFTGVDTGYAAGYDGKIYKTVNGGTNWILQTSGVSINIYSLYFPDDLTGYGACNAGYFVKTSNGSLTWASSATISASVLLSTFFTSNSTGYMCGGDGTILKTIVGGVNCTPTANAGNNTSICNGASTFLNASGGVTYSWSPATGLSATNVSNPLASPTSTTTYTVTVTANNSCTSTDDVVITVNTGSPASVAITANPTGTICSGTSVTFTATATNGGTTPTYQWKKGGSNISGATNSTYTSTTLADADIITCVMTSNATCATGSPATSNAITMSVNSSLPVSVSIAASPSGAICEGTSVTFSASPVNGGTPTYQWKKGATNISGATNSTYTSTTFANGDIITCIMTSSASCATGSPATSNAITMTVNPILAASVSIFANPTGAICAGTSVTFTASATNGGTPTYQWKNGGTNISGATNSTYTSTTLANGDNITCVMTSNATCATGSPATSNAITMTVNPILPASVSITANPSGAICAGTSVTFTASAINGGTPTYQWKKGGTNVSGATNSTYTSTTLTNGDIITCVMTSNATCATGSPATSNAITMTVNPILPASVSITANPSGAICEGTSVTFSAAAVNGGTPTYQWKNGGTNISGATNSTYTSATLANGDIISCVMTSNATCATGSPATSNAITMTVNPILTASVSIAATPSDVICEGASVTFTATATNGGGTPTYQWKNGGTNISGATNSTYTNASLINGDIITCVMTSTETCVTGSPTTSNAITMTVNPILTASVNIAAIPSGTICEGTSVTFTATPVNGGTPAYQWVNSGTNISGETNSTYTSATFANGDIITCVMTSDETCVTASPATSNAITITVNPGLPASVSIAVVPTGSICEGTSVTFTATPVNGGTPIYQWKNGGTNISGATNSTYTSATLADGDIITCVMTSNATCATGSPATSNAITMTVNPILTASVTITEDPSDTICDGISVTFTATAINGGTPAYQWVKGGTNISGETNSTYTSTTLANGDIISCVMTSDTNCVIGSPATSNMITMTVNPIPPTPIITLLGDTLLISDADSLNQWYINDSIIPGATDTSYIVTTNGYYYVIVTINGCMSDTSNIISTTVGFDEVSLNNEFVMYPNPATNSIQIETQLKSVPVDARIEILNIEGQTIICTGIDENHKSIDISSLARGMYFVRMKTRNGISVKKLIKE
jgi:photosystem II stability/assembly factor-like uncharacterized protein